MAKFQPTSPEDRHDEDVEADHFEDKQDFVDFIQSRGGRPRIVARYRSRDIRRILRTED
jgi:hypothetical protein